MPKTQAEKTAELRALHAAPGAFVIANAWDVGSARILTAIGFKALATSSGASAGVLGRRDGKVTREEALAHGAAIAGATELPVSADLEKGFGDTPEAVAETIRLACGVGLAGGSIEDASGDPAHPLFDRRHAAERVAAAVEAAKGSGFVVTARAENFIRGRPDLDDMIRRLVAYEEAGADVLMAPGLPDLQSVRTVCASLSKPFNFMMGIPGKSFSVAELRECGVKRISLATSLYRAAMGGLIAAAREIQDSGTATYIDRVPGTAELNAFFPG